MRILDLGHNFVVIIDFLIVILEKGCDQLFGFPAAKEGKCLIDDVRLCILLLVGFGLSFG